MLRIIKFGGTSLYDIHRIRNAVNIVFNEHEKGPVLVVVSALGGVTDEILSVMNSVLKSDDSWKERYELLKKRHLNTLHELPLDNAQSQKSRIYLLLDLLKKDFSNLYGKQVVTAREKDILMSYGERLSCQIFSAALLERRKKSSAFETHKLVRTNNRFGDADVDSAETIRLIRATLHPVGESIPVVTGFIGSTATGEITTLGRSGSDYSASIMGEALDAGEVQIWTDVNGVLTADPDIVPNAVTIPQLHYSEIAEMAHFGAKVLHPRSVLPLQKRQIPIRIKNTLRPEETGTVITQEYQPTPGRIRSVSVKKDIMVIAVRSKSLDRIDVLSYRALKALESKKIPVLLNTAASSDYGITVVVHASEAEKAKEALMAEFDLEFREGGVDEPEALGHASMVTVIGDKLEHDLGISGAILSVLGENGIAPLAMAKGLANRHLSLLLNTRETERAVRLFNDHFCIHPHRVRLFIAGIGAVGGQLIRLLDDLHDPRVDLSIIGACDTEKMAWHPLGIEPVKVLDRLKEGQPVHWNFILSHLLKEYPYRTIFVDATGDPEVAKKYAALLEAGIHVVTPSKRANTLKQEYFDTLMFYTVNKKTHYLYEATVGAGMPVIQTINDLRRSGDKIVSIRGVVSGTMTYLFSKLEEGEPFDAIIRSVKELGISEPDPRDDLSGEDVARKFMILARTAGIRLEREDVDVQPLIPESYYKLSLDAFFEALPEQNSLWKEKVEEAAWRNEVLRYVGKLEEGKVKVAIDSVPVKSSLGSLYGTDNFFAFHTQRYSKHPFVIQGPGAGKRVTAAGVLADIQKISRRLLK